MMKPIPPNISDLLDATQVSSAWGVSRGKVYQLAREGKLRCYSIGDRLLRFAPEDVQDFLSHNRLPREEEE